MRYFVHTLVKLRTCFVRGAVSGWVLLWYGLCHKLEHRLTCTFDSDVLPLLNSIFKYSNQHLNNHEHSGVQLI